MRTSSIPVREKVESSIREGIRVNVTLCFSQQQAAEVYSASRGSKGPIYVSPFVGRLDDQGENGMDLVRNIKTMYRAGDGHVHVLAASIRNLEHLLYSLALGVELATVPAKLLLQWAEKSTPMPGREYVYQAIGANGINLKAIPYEELNLDQPWEQFDINHPLTKKGIEKFVADYKSTLKSAA
jgi:transaldolase